MTSNYSAEVPSSIPRKGCDELMEKIQVLDKLHSDMSYGAVGCAFSANESTMYIK